MAALSELTIIIIIISMFTTVVEGASWCVVRSDASNEALQTAMDYACGSGADCLPIQSNGLCYLPNTVQAHASYAFNSYYQRRSMAPGTCDFSGTATVAKTDPSYGSCVYPSSLSTAGGPVIPSTPPTTPITTDSNVPTTSSTGTPVYGGTGGGGGGGTTPGLTPGMPTTDNSNGYLKPSVATLILMPVSCLLVLLFTLQPM